LTIVSYILVHRAGSPYGRQSTSSEATVSRKLYLTDMALLIGSLSGILSCGSLRRSPFLAEAHLLIDAYSRQQKFLPQWFELSIHDAAWTIVIWFLAVLDRIRGLVARADTMLDTVPAADWCDVFMFAFGSALVLAMSFYILHVCRCLTRMVDSFCYRIIDHTDPQLAVKEWNLLQAVVRTACASIQSCFFVLQIVGTVVVLVTFIDLPTKWQALSYVSPGLIVSAGIFRIFFWAATVTDKCARVPTLVNSLSTGSDLDQNRMYIVDYVVHSQAGFYMFEVRLTSAMVLKFFYFACVVAFGITTRSIQQDS